MSNGAKPPPPIFEALGKAWEIYKSNFGPIFIGTLCALLCSFIPVIGQLMALPGLYYVALKAVRGEKIDPGDGFIAFQAILDHIVMGLLLSAGALLCIVGVFISRPLFVPGFFYILDKKMNFSDAMNKCFKDVWPNIFSWLIFDFVVAFIPALIGLLLCGIGTIFTLPIATIAMAYAYEKSLKGDDVEVVGVEVQAV